MEWCDGGLVRSHSPSRHPTTRLPLSASGWNLPEKAGASHCRARGAHQLLGSNSSRIAGLAEGQEVDVGTSWPFDKHRVPTRNWCWSRTTPGVFREHSPWLTKAPQSRRRWRCSFDRSPFTN